MAENSKIEWTDHTFNPWIGCTKVSPACDGCYAENLMANRYHRVEWGAGEEEGLYPSHWREALTAPGATTKSDGGVEGHATANATGPKERSERPGSPSAKPTDYVAAGIKPGPSDPSSTRTARWRSMPAGLFVDPTQGLMIRFEDNRHRKATVAEKEVMLRALRGADFPDALRIPLHELQADAGYLVGRVVADSSCAPAITEAIRSKLAIIEQAARALLETHQIRRR